MRGFLKMVSAVTCGVRHTPTRCLCGRPPAPLGGRILSNPKDVFQHNMWDHVQWSPEEMEKARQKAEENSREQISIEEQVRYDKDANKYWDKFYEIHQNKFFKNRQWLFSEFPELLPQGCATSRTPEGQKNIVPDFLDLSKTQTDEMESQQQGSHIPNREELKEKQHSASISATFPGQHASFRILEVGCGVGNSVFPIINAIRGSNAFLYCCDFSSRAIQLVREHSDYDPAVCHAFVHDVCDVSTLPFPQESLDVIAVVFVLSSIHPQRMQNVVNRLAGYLKHGGIILFRDYGRYDLAQLRFKKGQCLSDNFYTRQDGTCVYFFIKDEIHQLFTNAGLEEVQNLEDKRLQVNRGKKVVMRRVWMQSKYQKPYRVPPGS